MVALDTHRQRAVQDIQALVIEGQLEAVAVVA